MKRYKIVIVAVTVIVITISAYLLLYAKASTDLPVCVYGPNDAVLNEPCEPGEFYP